MEKNRHRKRLRILGFCWVFVMVFIFVMSSRDGDESSALSAGLMRLLFGWMIPLFGESVAEFFIRKAAHTFEFFCLALASQSFFSELLLDRAHRRAAAYSGAALWCFLYACSDEWHQLYVPGRAGQFRDVLIDCAGSAIGLLLLALLARLRKRPKKQLPTEQSG